MLPSKKYPKTDLPASVQAQLTRLFQIIGVNASIEDSGDDIVISYDPSFQFSAKLPFLEDYQIEADDPDLSFAFHPLTVQLTGDYNLKKDNVVKAELNLVAAEGNYVQFGPQLTDIDFSGEISVKNIEVVPDVLEIEELSLKKTTDELEGSFSIKLPSLGNAGIEGEIGFKNGELNSLGGAIDLGDAAIPLEPTPFTLKGGAMAVTGLAPGQLPQVGGSITLGTDGNVLSLKTSVVLNAYGASLLIGGDIVTGELPKNAWEDDDPGLVLQVDGEDFLKANGAANLNWQQGTLSMNATVTIADGFLQGEQNFAFDKELDFGFCGEMDAVIPKEIYLIGGEHLASTGMGVLFSNDKNYSNDYAFAYTTISLLFSDVEVGAKVDFQGNHEFMGSDTIATVTSDAKSSINSIANGSLAQSIAASKAQSIAASNQTFVLEVDPTQSTAAPDLVIAIVEVQVGTQKDYLLFNPAQLGQTIPLNNSSKIYAFDSHSRWTELFQLQHATTTLVGLQAFSSTSDPGFASLQSTCAALTETPLPFFAAPFQNLLSGRGTLEIGGLSGSPDSLNSQLSATAGAMPAEHTFMQLEADDPQILIEKILFERAIGGGLFGLTRSASGHANLPQKSDNSSIYTINYAAFDPDSTAKISLYYDTDGEGVDGIALAKNLKERDGKGSYRWDTRNLSTGEYHVYAVIDDGNNVPKVHYFPNPVKVMEEGAPKQVQDLQAQWDRKNSVELSWQAVSDRDIAYYVITSTDEAAGSKMEQTITTRGLETQIQIGDLHKGDTYKFGVSAVDRQGNKSTISDPVAVQLGKQKARFVEDGEWRAMAYPGKLYRAKLDVLQTETLKLLEAPKGATIDQAGTFSWQPNQVAAGWQKVRVQVDDTFGRRHVIERNLYVSRGTDRPSQSRNRAKDQLIGMSHQGEIIGRTTAGSTNTRSFQGHQAVQAKPDRLLIGEAGADVFVLRRNELSQITNFEQGIDQIQVQGISFKQLEFMQQGKNTLMKFNGETIAQLQGVNRQTINAADFV